MKILSVIIMSATFLSYCQFSYADANCKDICDNNYDKCVANIINLPEPRTYEEQEKLQECYDIRGNCQHSCEDTNEPAVIKQKEEE